MHHYEELVVWQRAHQLMEKIYDTSSRFPREELYVLTAQLRKSALSVPSNLAEGCGRFDVGDFRRFVSYARGSSKETDYQLLAAAGLGYLSGPECLDLRSECDQIQRMLTGLYRHLSRKK